MSHGSGPIGFKKLNFFFLSETLYRTSLDKRLGCHLVTEIRIENGQIKIPLFSDWNRKFQQCVECN